MPAAPGALRWAEHLMPQELMEFMRHSSIQVTLDYYVGQRAMETAARMWAVKEGTSGVGEEPHKAACAEW
jgi:hypothetical protein